MEHGCRAKLASGQWWNFCGETDMGQTMPALCEHCGGEHIRADDPDAKRKVEELNLKQLALTEELRKKERLSGWILGASDWITTPVAAESYVGDGQPNCPAANEAISKAASSFGWGADFVIIKRAPTPAQRLARNIREKVDPFALGLNDDQIKALSQMIDDAAGHAVHIGGWPVPPSLHQD